MNGFTQILTGLAATGVLLMSASLSNAQAACAPRSHTVGQLENKLHEHVQGRGLTPHGKAMLEIFVSKTGSWTVIVSRPDGSSCFVAGGDSWHQVKSVPGNPV